MMDRFEISRSGSILNPGTDWTIRGVPDLDGNGRADLLWRHDDGAVLAWFMSGTTIVTLAAYTDPGPDWSIVNMMR